MKTTFSIAVTAALVAVLLSPSAPAMAANGPGEQIVSQETSSDASCEAQLKALKKSEFATETSRTTYCTVKTVTRASAPQVASAASIQSDPSLTSVQKVSLLAAAVSGIVYYKTWSQEKAGITYYEIHKGKFYYDNTNAWSTRTLRGWTGWHDCQAAGSWGVTVNVEVVSCKSTVDGSSTIDRETYKVSALVSGSPVNYTLAMSMLLKKDGSTVSRAY